MEISSTTTRRDLFLRVSASIKNRKAKRVPFGDTERDELINVFGYCSNSLLMEYYKFIMSSK